MPIISRIQLLALSLLVLGACTREELEVPDSEPGSAAFISAVDISSFPEISQENPTFYDAAGNERAFLDLLKENGVTTIRLRLWVHPASKHSGLEEVKQFAQTLKASGFKTWLALHYSDTWAHPGQQEIPSAWQGLDLPTLRDSVYGYTQQVVRELQPDYIQIGNEINDGLLLPQGDITQNNAGFIALLQSACLAVRENADDCRIILHVAGHEQAEWFFSQVSQVDYDVMGLSYYPIWHGKSLDTLRQKMQDLVHNHHKPIVIAETAYPFTLNWNDWTDNIVGLDEQLILPAYPATVEGQQTFIKHLKTLIQEVDEGLGFCYWGAELIAWKGNEAKDASPWENQALFDFQHKALPALAEFNHE